MFVRDGGQLAASQQGYRYTLSGYNRAGARVCRVLCWIEDGTAAVLGRV